MTHHEKTLLRQATAICEQQTPNKPVVTSSQLPGATWQAADGLLCRIRRAQRRGWYRAARRLQCDLRFTLQQLQSQLAAIERQIPSPYAQPKRITVRDLFEDLMALYEEFQDVAFDWSSKTLTVTTEPIELEGVSLGRFEIRLDCGRSTDGSSSTYRVVALDPNPAATNESVTHPHVQDEAVCEGEGSQPIRHALEEGRLFDFFTIVENLLKTYNRGSPYVSLADWYGVECADCGLTIDADDQRTCYRCDTTICTECYVVCTGCNEIYCNECVSNCEDCDESFCGSCLTECSRCGIKRCRGCLDDKERCTDCHDKETNTAEDPSAEEDSSADADTSLYPDRVGEAAVSA